MAVEHLTKENFKRTIEEQTKTVIIDFYADWCRPCKMIAPFLEEIEAENEDVAVYKVDIDTDPELAVQYDVRSIPSLISFKNGEIYKRTLGAQPKESLLELVK